MTLDPYPKGTINWGARWRLAIEGYGYALINESATEAGWFFVTHMRDYAWVSGFLSAQVKAIEMITARGKI